MNIIKMIVNHEDKIKANEVVGTLLSIKNLKQQIVKYFLLLHQFIIIIWCLGIVKKIIQII